MNMFMYSINYLLVKMYGMVLSIKILKVFVAGTEQMICQEMSILHEYMGESNFPSQSELHLLSIKITLTATMLHYDISKMAYLMV